MTLTAMLCMDRDALACDLWETYHVTDMEALPVRDLAVLSCGLRENSRIKMLMTGRTVPTDQLVMAGCFDLLSGIRSLLAGTEEAPKSMVKALLGIEEEHEDTILSYSTPEEWEAEKRRILGE